MVRRLDPSARGWRKTASAICAETLDADHPSEVGQSWRSLVLSERAGHWATGPRVPAQQRAERQQIATRFLSPLEPPSAEVMAGPLGLLAWFARACASGVTLTTSGYLPRALVAEGAERHGWWEWDKPPRSEADVWELRLVHRAARRLGVVRRRGRILTTTRAGHTIGRDPLSWWPRLVLLGQGGKDYRDALFEAAALAIIDGDTHHVDDLGHRVGEVLAGQGWHTDGRPMSAAQHRRHIYMAINPWRLWGFVDYRSGCWGPTPEGPRQIEPTTVTATPAGLAAAALWLHHRITGPRSGI